MRVIVCAVVLVLIGGAIACDDVAYGVSCSWGELKCCYSMTSTECCILCGVIKPRDVNDGSLADAIDVGKDEVDEREPAEEDSVLRAKIMQPIKASYS